jgi:replicative DNA helicase
VSERVVELNRTPVQSTPPPSEFERTPPQDLGAEQSVLGGMLLNKDAIADVIEEIRTGDFYRPAHQIIFDVIIDLYGKGEPADAITVGAELTKNGDAGRIGGMPYLHTLVSSVPTAANAGYYAKIVAELAILRRLVDAGTRIVQLGYSAEGQEVDDIVDRAQQTIYDVTERRTSEDYTLLEELMQPTMDELEAIGGRAGQMSGVPTGFMDLDKLTNGLHPGQLIVIAGRPGLGKALALDTPLVTPTGWTTMGAVQVGAQLMGADGRPTTVVAATEVMVDRPCYEVVFSDGSSIVADAEHQWVTDALSGGTAIRTTAQLCRDLDAGHAVLTTAALDLPAGELPAAPYALGVWLAGGSEDRDADLMILDRDVVLESLVRASAAQRREALAGVADVAGTVEPDGVVALPLWANELAVSLGHVTRESGAVLLVFTEEQVFERYDLHLEHKEALTSEVLLVGRRAVVAVTPLPSVPVRCVEVDNEAHLYLAGRTMIPTHNSTLGLDIARSASIKHSQAAAIFSLEMSKTEITMRLLSAEARVPLHHMRSGSMTDDDWARLARRMGEVAEAPLYIDDSPNLTMMEIRAKARRLKQRNELRLIVIDYLQLMSGNKKSESRQQEVSEISRALKLLAKELEIPVIAMSQLNRGAEQRTDKKPMLSDLRESGSIEQDADMVLLLHREDAYEKESPRAGEADFIVAKHRNGPTATITVAFQGHYSRFVDMSPS